MNKAKSSVQAPCYLIEDSPAEIAALDQAFWVKIAHQQADADKAREVGIPALKRLFELAETRDSGQIKTVATVLAERLKCVGSCQIHELPKQNAAK